MFDEGYDNKRDWQTIAIVLSFAFFMGLIFGEGSLGWTMIISICLYVGLRWVQVGDYYATNRKTSIIKRETRSTKERNIRSDNIKE